MSNLLLAYEASEVGDYGIFVVSERIHGDLYLGIGAAKWDKCIVPLCL